MSAFGNETIEQQIRRLEQERATLRGRQVKHNNLSPEEEARLGSLDAEINSLKKNRALQTKPSGEN